MITCGIDPSRASFAVSFIEDMREFEYIEYENSLNGIGSFIAKLATLKSEPLICIEGYGDFAKRLSLTLTDKSKERIFKLYEINPQMSRRLKESMTFHKTDHIDAFTCGLFPFFRNDLKELSLNKYLEGLKNLTRQFRKVSNTITAMKNQIHAALNQAFGPTYKLFFKDLNEMSLNFYSEFGSFEEISKASTRKIHNVIVKGNSCRYKGENGLDLAKKIKETVKGINYYHLQEYFEIQSNVIKGYAKILLDMLKQKKLIHQEIDKIVKKVFPGYSKHFKDLKGLTALRFGIIISEIRDINNFESDSKLASYSGQSQRRFQSSSVDRTIHQNNYNRYLSYVFHFIAMNNVRKNGVFYELYNERKMRYNKKLRALKAIKRKIVRYVFVGLKNYRKELNYEVFVNK